MTITLEIARQWHSDPSKFVADNFSQDVPFPENKHDTISEILNSIRHPASEIAVYDRDESLLLNIAWAGVILTMLFPGVTFVVACKHAVACNIDEIQNRILSYKNDLYDIRITHLPRRLTVHFQSHEPSQFITRSITPQNLNGFSKKLLIQGVIGCEDDDLLSIMINVMKMNTQNSNGGYFVSYGPHKTPHFLP